jgi:hypothetical protein
VDTPPITLADAGVENVNAQVDEFISSGALRRLLAMTEIAFSNSMIESWWRALKHQWLYLNPLDTVSSLRRLVAFYVESIIPDSPIPPSAGRPRMRCTSTQTATCPTSSKLGDRRRARPAWKQTAPLPARPANTPGRRVDGRTVEQSGGQPATCTPLHSVPRAAPYEVARGANCQQRAPGTRGSAQGGGCPRKNSRMS